MTGQMDPRLNLALALLAERKILVASDDGRTFRITHEADTAMQLGLDIAEVREAYMEMVTRGVPSPIARLALVVQFASMAVEAQWAEQWWKRLLEMPIEVLDPAAHGEAPTGSESE